MTPPPPLHPASVSSSRTKGGGTHSPGGEGGGGVYILEDARHRIGLLQYNLSTSERFRTRFKCNVAGFFSCHLSNTKSLLFQRWAVRKRSAKSQNLRTLFLSSANVVICGFVICGPYFFGRVTDLRLAVWHT